MKPGTLTDDERAVLAAYHEARDKGYVLNVVPRGKRSKIYLFEQVQSETVTPSLPFEKPKALCRT